MSVGLLLLALAFDAAADTPVGSGLVEDAAPAPEAGPVMAELARAWGAMDAERLLEEAIDRRARGDRQGARERLLVLQGRGEWLPAVRYQLAVTDELEERYEEAARGYREVLTAWPDEPIARDARFRLAVVLEDLGQAREAAAEARRLAREGDLDERDRLALELVRGAAELDAGQARGGRRIERAEARLAGGEELGWARARARLAVARAAVREAARVRIVNNGKAGARLEARVALLSAAMDEVMAIARLNEPEPALHGLLLLGDAFAALHRDLLASPDPPGLSADQLAIFRTELAKSSEPVRRRARALYDEGVALAVRTGWEGAVAGTLRERRAAMDAEDGR